MSKQGDHIDLIVGLGNPGDKYARTRHNAGFWFVDELARRANASLRAEKKFHGETARVDLHGHTVQLLKPDTFMNLSGQAVQAISAFYKWPPGRILVVHDEIDLPAGTIRLKRGGGHGGNNGLRDITQKLGKDFLRLRVGVGRPTRGEVIDYVLGRPSPDDQIEIERAMDKGHDVLPLLLSDGLEKAMHRLHSKPGEKSVRKPSKARKTSGDDAKGSAADTAHGGDPATSPTQSTPETARDATAARGSAEATPDADAGRSLRDQLSDWFHGKR